MLIIGLAFAFASACSYATMNVCVRKATERGSSDGGVLLALLINVALHGMVVSGRLAAGVAVDWHISGIVWFMLAGVLTTLLGRVALYAGIRRTGPARAAALKNAAPIVAVAGGLLLLGERLTPVAGIGVLVALVGYALFMRDGLRPARQARSAAVRSGAEGRAAPGAGTAGEAKVGNRNLRGSVELAGYACCGLAAVFYGTGAVVRRVGVGALSDTFVAALVSAVSGLVVYLAYLRLRGQLGRSIEAMARQRHPYFWYAGVVSTLGQLSAYLAVSYAAVSYVSVVASSDTLITPILAAAWLGRTEALSRRLAAAATTVFAGTVLVLL